MRSEHGNGGKQRHVMLSEPLLGIPRGYSRRARPPLSLFPVRSPDKLIEPAALHARLPLGAGRGGPRQTRERAHPRRDGFATQLLERGVDIRVIQELSGRENLSTTARHTRVSTHVIANTAGPLHRLSLRVTPQGWTSRTPPAFDAPSRRATGIHPLI